MNGEMYQICCIAAAAKTALKENSQISYVPEKYINKIEFLILQETDFSDNNGALADDISFWYDCLIKKGLSDIKVLAPLSYENISALGFSNMTQSSLVCFYDGKVTYFTAHWEFVASKKAWNVLYTEHEWNDVPDGKPRFENNTDSFAAILTDIKELAHNIGCDNFAEIFDKALNILLTSDIQHTQNNMPLPQIPEENLSLFGAADTADVFGAMGSWNDNPPYMAQKKGLIREYETLSAELLKQMRLAVLYAVNEW